MSTAKEKLDDIARIDTIEQTANSALQTKADVEALAINASSLTQDANNRLVTDTEKATWNGKLDSFHDITLTLNGDVTGSATFTNMGNATLTATIADDSHNHVISNVDGLQTALDGKLNTTHDMTLTLNGDVTGSATFTNMGNATLTATIADDSHNHTIANVDGLQTALNGKASLSGADFTGTIKIENTTPQITLSDTTAGADDFFIRVGGNNFFVLVDRDENGTFDSPIPLTLDSDTNKAYVFDNEILDAGNILSTITDGSNYPVTSNAIYDALAGKLGITAKAADSDKLDGMQPATTQTANTIVQRDSNGAINSKKVVIDNGSADGGEIVFKSNGYNSMNIDNNAGRLRIFDSAERFAVYSDKVKSLMPFETNGDITIQKGSNESSSINMLEAGDLGAILKYDGDANIFQILCNDATNGLQVGLSQDRAVSDTGLTYKGGQIWHSKNALKVTINANGTCVELRDGFKIQSHRLTVPSASYGAYSVTSLSSYSWTFPVPFTSEPLYQNIQHKCSWVYDFIVGAETVDTTYLATIYIKNHSGSAHTTDLKLYYIAMGY